MIVVDISGTQSPYSGHRGIGRYNLELASSLAAHHGDLIDAFAFDPDLPLGAEIEERFSAARVVPFDALSDGAVDVFHVAAPFEPKPIEAIVPPLDIAHLVVTHYDLIPWLFRDRYFRFVDSARYTARLGLLLGADAIVTLSRASAYDLEHSLGVDSRRVTVVGAGVGVQFRTLAGDGERRGALDVLDRELGLGPGAIVVPAAMDWRKNPETAIAAYAQLDPSLRDAHRLVVLGLATPGHLAWLRSLAAEHGVAGQVVSPGYIADDVLVALYQTSALVVFPSRYEGFGLPVLEARGCGARVICSNVSSLPEVMPLRSARFDPDNADELAALMTRALSAADFQAQLDRVEPPAVSWEQAADLVAGVYTRLLSGR